MVRTLAYAIVVSGLVLLGCRPERARSGTAWDGSAPGADAGAPDAPMVLGDDAAAPDAPAPEVPGTLRGVGTSQPSCAAGCAAIGFPCVTTCEGRAGRASYGYYDWDYGWYRETTSADLASCDDAAAPTQRDAEGMTRDLGEVYCCCAIPEVTVVTAPASNDRACRDVCTDRGLGACAEFHEWPGEDYAGGTLATYERPETGSVTYVVMGCDAIPPATDYIAGATRYLRDYDCACTE